MKTAINITTLLIISIIFSLAYSFANGILTTKDHTADVVLSILLLIVAPLLGIAVLVHFANKYDK